MHWRASILSEVNSFKLCKQHCHVAVNLWINNTLENHKAILIKQVWFHKCIKYVDLVLFQHCLYYDLVDLLK